MERERENQVERWASEWEKEDRREKGRKIVKKEWVVFLCSQLINMKKTKTKKWTEEVLVLGRGRNEEYLVFHRILILQNRNFLPDIELCNLKGKHSLQLLIDVFCCFQNHYWIHGAFGRQSDMKKILRAVIRDYSRRNLQKASNQRR